MADEKEDEQKQDEQKQEEQKQDEQKQAAPAYVPADEFKLFQATIQDTLGAVRESLQALAGSKPAPTAPSIEDATDEEIDAVLAEGKGAKVFRKMVDAAAKRLDVKYDARAREIEDTASGSLSSMAAEMAKPKMKYYDKPYIKTEVDAYISKLPPNQRLNPENYIVVYNAVAGSHMDKILAEELEAAARKSRDTKGVVPGGSTGRSNESPTSKSVKEVFGDEAARELRNRNRTLDTIAQSFGFKDAEEYMKYAEGEGEEAVH